MINWHDYFLYSDGALISIMRRRGAKYMKPAGRKNASCGYIEVMVNYKRYQAHRVIWEMHNGAIPNGMEIDHINGIEMIIGLIICEWSLAGLTTQIEQRAAPIRVGLLECAGTRESQCGWLEYMTTKNQFLLDTSRTGLMRYARESLPRGLTDTMRITGGLND